MDQHLLLLVPDAPSHHRHVTALREAGFRVAAVPSRAEALRAAALSGGLLVAESSLLDGSPDVPPGLLIIHQLPLLDEPCLESAEACVPLATTPSRLVGVVRRQLRRRAREERLRGAARTLGLGVFEFDFATQRGEYSPEVKAILGVPEGDAIPLDADFVPLAVHPEDRDTLLAAVARAAEPEAGGEFSCDYRVRHPDGTVRWVQARARLFFDEGAAQRPVWVSGMLLDVTAQREATARLRAEERRYHDIFEATGTAIWESDYTAVADELDALQARGVTDVRAHLEAHPEELGRIMAGRRVLDVNPAALRMHGARSKRELLEGMSRLRTPSAREMMIRTLEALARGETRLDFDMTAGTLDGGSVDTLASVSISPRGERPVRVLLSLHDVTPLKRAETVLLEANQRKDEFLAMLAHELRNPLAPIRNAAEALQLVRTEEPVVAWARDVIERQVAHLAHIVDDLLDISRIMQGKATLRRQPVDLRAVARSAVETSRPVIDARGHAFIVRLPPKPVVVDGDFVRLAQVIANLLNNAGKYTPPEGRISLDVEAVEGEAQVRVVDSGEGMAPELLTQVFDLFTQAHRTLDRAQGGLGIGLTVVKRLVELHGGTVVASSDGPGRGSTFTLRLPLCDALPQAPESPRAEARRPAASALRVLVVDDSRDAAESLAELLRLSGHEVRTAEDALAALAVMREFRPEVGLLDLGLPGMDGFELAGRLRSDPDGAAMMLVAVTGYGREEDVKQALSSGFDHHMVKPIDLQALRALLERRRAAAGGTEPSD